MRLGGRLSAAIEILTDMEARHRPAAEALKDWGVAHRFAGSGDRAAIGTLVHDALRLRRSSEWRLAGEGPRAAVLGAFLRMAGLEADALAATIGEDDHAPAPLTEGEKAAWTGRDLADAPDAVRADCPDWCVPLLSEAFGSNWVEEAAALAGRPPLDLRVNTLKSDDARVLKALAQQAARLAGFVPHAVRIAPIAGLGRHPNVQAETGFQKGWFEIQDEGSQAAAWLAAPREPGQILDLCAGGGGKTLALAARTGNRGQIFAHDADRTRLAPIHDRLRRAGARNVQVIDRREGLVPLAGRMDLVLVDAPCTGSGTWRRKPDAKWRLTDRQLAARVAEQGALLDDAAGFVRPGGRLAYVTCSVFPAENGGHAAAFLARHPDFAAVPMAGHFAHAFPDAPLSPRFPDAGGALFSPARTATDGFFVALFERRS